METNSELRAQLLQLIAVAERRQQSDMDKWVGDAQSRDDVGVFWEGYQASLHDLLFVLEEPSEDETWDVLVTDVWQFLDVPHLQAGGEVNWSMLVHRMAGYIADRLGWCNRTKPKAPSES